MKIAEAIAQGRTKGMVPVSTRTTTDLPGRRG